jgi:hypothetical protein
MAQISAIFSRALPAGHEDIMKPCIYSIECSHKYWTTGRAGKGEGAQNIEYECWMFKGALPPQEQLAAKDMEPTDAYFWRISFDPKTLETL